MKPYTLVAAIVLMTGCAALPTLRQSVRAAPRTQQPPVIMASGEVLSAQETRALISRLKREAEPTKILDGHLRFMEEIRAAPLTAGNRATLLIDRPTTYAAMSAAIVKATVHTTSSTMARPFQRVARVSCARDDKPTAMCFGPKFDACGSSCCRAHGSGCRTSAKNLRRCGSPQPDERVNRHLVGP
jgi:hypothetical protein